jgi:hypothetical protein
MLVSLNVCCGHHRWKASKIEEVIAHNTLSGWLECNDRKFPEIFTGETFPTMFGHRFKHSCFFTVISMFWDIFTVLSMFL